MFGPAPIEFGFLFRRQFKLPFALLFTKALPEHHRKFGSLLGRESQQPRNRRRSHVSIVSCIDNLQQIGAKPCVSLERPGP